MQNPISITSIASISSLGSNMDAIWENYCNPNHNFQRKDFDNFTSLIAPLGSNEEEEIEKLRLSNNRYKSLDRSVLMAIYASRKAVKAANWKDGDYGINIGSSRGATSLFEKFHEDFLETNKTQTLTSPTTTLGNISSWIAHDLQSQGPTISHSITCSTALHALLNGVAWINAGMSKKFLVGGSEAPLTAFTIAQMKAMKIYAANTEDDFPCRTLDFDKKKNTMILGEGASIMCLEKEETKDALAIIEGIGYATEILEHNISISDDAQCFQKSMQMALKNTDVSEVDVIVMHAPGTLKGDSSEYKAIQEVFGNSIPSLTSNKWKIGHTFGASGALSIELAILMMLHQKFIDIPFLDNQKQPKQIKKVLVNAVGFGGNAVSILLSNQN
ncbi:MAG: 3-oxoacyl-[acyl-carrier-protein] synthase II [Porticoccaceae bacterium]|jgi:3-oxoacyl-[acyl-carrier-protein] synthase II